VILFSHQIIHHGRRSVRRGVALRRCCSILCATRRQDFLRYDKSNPAVTSRRNMLAAIAGARGSAAGLLQAQPKTSQDTRSRLTPSRSCLASTHDLRQFIEHLGRCIYGGITKRARRSPMRRASARDVRASPLTAVSAGTRRQLRSSLQPLDATAWPGPRTPRGRRVRSPASGIDPRDDSVIGDGLANVSNVLCASESGDPS